MTLKPELVSCLTRDLSIFGLSECALKIVKFIASKDLRGYFYVSISDFIKEIPNCTAQDIEKVTNYLSSTEPPVLARTYCFVDDDSIFHELINESLLAFQETKKLYHPASGKLVESQDVKIFMLFKTSVGNVVVA